MFCESCGHEIGDDAKFCKECGSKIKKTAAASSVFSWGNLNKQGGYGKKTIAGITLGFFAVLLVMEVGFLIWDYKPRKAFIVSELESRMQKDYNYFFRDDGAIRITDYTESDSQKYGGLYCNTCQVTLQNGTCERTVLLNAAFSKGEDAWNFFDYAVGGMEESKPARMPDKSEILPLIPEKYNYAIGNAEIVIGEQSQKEDVVVIFDAGISDNLVNISGDINLHLIWDDERQWWKAGNADKADNYSEEWDLSGEYTLETWRTGGFGSNYNITLSKESEDLFSKSEVWIPRRKGAG